MFRVFLSIALAVSYASCAFVFASDKELELKDAFVGWSQLKSRLRHSKVTCDERVIKSGSRDSDENTTYTIIADGDKLRVDTVLPGQMSSAVIGSEYFFAVEKATKAKSYAIRVLDVNERMEISMDGEVSTYRDRMLEYLFPSVSVASIEGEKYFAENGLTIRSIDRVENDLIKVKYDLKYDDDIVRSVGLEPFTSVGAVVALDTKNNWRVVSFNIPMPEATLSGSIEYADNGFPKTYREVYERSDYKVVKVREYQDWVDYSAEPVEFSLASFGLPEPNVESLRSGPKKAFPFIIIFGAVLFAIGLGLWMTARTKGVSRQDLSKSDLSINETS